MSFPNTINDSRAWSVSLFCGWRYFEEKISFKDPLPDQLLFVGRRCSLLVVSSGIIALSLSVVLKRFIGSVIIFLSAGIFFPGFLIWDFLLFCCPLISGQKYQILTWLFRFIMGPFNQVIIIEIRHKIIVIILHIISTHKINKHADKVPVITIIIAHTTIYIDNKHTPMPVGCPSAYNIIINTYFIDEWPLCTMYTRCSVMHQLKINWNNWHKFTLEWNEMLLPTSHNRCT